MSGPMPASGGPPEPEAAAPEANAREAAAAPEVTPVTWSEPAPRAGTPAETAETAETTVRAPGWREVLLVSAAVVLLVLGASVVTGYLPTDVQRVVFHEPLLIGFLVLGTVLVLWSVARRRPPA